MDRTLRDQILEMDMRVPRYTSYPTAPHFTALAEPRTYVQALRDIPAGEALSLYLHIPFCHQLCWYCGCHTKITRRYEPIAHYVGLLLKEIELIAKALDGVRRVSHIHFGGGSPGALSAEDFTRIMDTLGARFQIQGDAEIAMEIDPRNVDEGRVAAYANGGVNRISLGVQDFNARVMKAVNREQPFELSRDAMALFRRYGIENFNLDLIYGLPHQNVETTQSSIEQALTLNPDRIAFFGYAHVPWMKKHMRMIDEDALPQKDERFDMFMVGRKMLRHAGYQSVGIDHFAKSGDSLLRAYQARKLRRNFQGYTTDQSAYLIGMGASSIGQTTHSFFQNTPDMPVYEKMLERGYLPVIKRCAISADDRLRAYVISDLMCYFEVDLRDVCEKHNVGADYFAAELAALSTYVDLGFVQIEDDAVRIIKGAESMARLVSGVFDAYLRAPAETPRHAQAI